ncbi:nondiscriminating aspartyl-tRNA synthetase [Actinoplanes campanulatus]|uniref:Aspartate--tRNA(Asp/Asn) ligase n=1 Tax=Actinoplanes campanulatus TaxID=113559 RepID=A0A7W5FIS7_9ACTN|nr:aspartate--tRNA(Asn) ligase [Actinoplanes campanulatus]MBB3099984.1 nondiscriminating aspartyl-tRNA synthetase [Actinoplanes campanulatus]GGN29616.1 aspartate--tRNA(Asp/Asn) ligase [Actinoplanes campanulatus]GID42222.1 aspartate--tRNA(Asp/Asn) ligase [Actinoplanes campanulatus]
MQRILSTQLATTEPGTKVTIAGWIHRRRLLKSVAFLIVRDAAGLSQVVVTDPATREQVERLTEETVVEVTAVVTANEQAPQGVELTSPEILETSRVAVPLPFELHRPALSASLPTQLDHAALALRHPSRAANLRISAAVTRGFRRSLEEQRFVEIHTPKIVESATESGANVFELDYFGRPAYLAQSPQFFKQMMVGVFERVFEVGPVFRAEPSDTARHLAQYTSLDAEMGFIRDHRDVMAALTRTIAGMLGEVTGMIETPGVPDEIPAVHFAEALRIAGAPEDEPDLAPAHERAVGEWALREHGSEFVFVTGYPMRKRPFYTHPDPADPTWSNSFDLLFRGLEIVTGGQRLHRYEDYVAVLGGAGEQGYLDAFRYGMPAHGGWAIGLERFVARLTGAANVREVTAFPRDLHRVAP